MKILFLANRSSTHASRWANALYSRGYNICYCSVIDGDQFLNKGIKYHKLKYDKPLGYLTNYYDLKRVIKKYKPDLVHVHYASGNGLLASFMDFKPLLLSIYGSDVFKFPYRSILHRLIFKFILNKYTWLCSTGYKMADEVYRVYGEELNNIDITPFGVDINKFVPQKTPRKNKLVIGTIKKMEKIYGIDILIKAFSKILQDHNVDVELELLIVGGGREKNNLIKLADNEGIKNFVTFVGKVPHAQIQEYFNKLDIFVALSRYESFGVSVIEASACEKPVIVSDVGGLPEVVDNGETGLIVPKDDIDAAAEAMLKLINDEELRIRLGKNGRKKVGQLYNWEKNVDKMEEVYSKLV